MTTSTQTARTVRVRMLKPQCGLQPGAVAEFSTEFAAAIVARGGAEYIVEGKAGAKAAPVSNKRKAG